MTIYVSREEVLDNIGYGKSEKAMEVLTLGETMAVMNPLHGGPLRFVRTFEKRIGGAESNVAVGLTRLGHSSGWMGRVGDDEFGREVLAFVRGEGVDVSRVAVDPVAPTGLYFKERRGVSDVHTYYYRSNAAASRMSFEDLDLDYLLSGRFLHLTGITPTLSDSCYDLTQRLLSAANESETIVSFDVNIRWGLFNDHDPRKTLAPLAAMADIVFLSEEEAKFLFGGDDPLTIEKALQSTRAQTIVVHQASGAFVVQEDGTTERQAYPVEVIDTVGAGDAFVSGFLSGKLQGLSVGECLDIANACGACAVTVPGDVEGLPTAEEVFAFRNGHSGRER